MKIYQIQPEIYLGNLFSKYYIDIYTTLQMKTFLYFLTFASCASVVSVEDDEAFSITPSVVAFK